MLCLLSTDLPALPACPASCWCLDAQRAAANGLPGGQNVHAMHAIRAQQTHAHMHATLDALRRGDRLMTAGNVETPKYLPSDENEYVRKRTFLRVPLTGASTPGPGETERTRRGSATVWLVQVIHINVGGKKSPSYLGSNPLNKKIRLCAAAQNLGQAAAAAASTRGASRVVAVSLGDFNLTETEVKENRLARALVDHAFGVAANEGVKDKEGRLHQDLVLVDADRVPDVKVTPIPSSVLGFDGVHQAVRARIWFQGPAAAASAWSGGAAAATTTWSSTASCRRGAGTTSSGTGPTRPTRFLQKQDRDGKWWPLPPASASTPGNGDNPASRGRSSKTTPTTSSAGRRGSTC